MRILGIDPGSRVAGFGCLDKKLGACKLVDAGVIRMQVTLSFTERLGYLYETVDRLIEELNPQVLAIEKAFTFINASSALKLGELRGAVIACAIENGLEVREVAPKAVKKAITGNGNASKEQVSMFVENFLQFERGKLPHDVTDAIAIALSQSFHPPKLLDSF